MLSLKDKIVFAKYKDTPLISSKELRLKYKNDPSINFSEIYAEISKYQCKKYGHMLCGKNDHWLPKKVFDNRNTALRARKRRKCPTKVKVTRWTDMLGLEDER